MIRLRLFSIIILILLFLVLASQGIAQISNEAVVLTMKADKLRPVQNNSGAIIARDPFNWPPEQIAKFRELDREKRSGLFAGLNLTGIIWDHQKPLAVINGKMLGIGERIKGAEVRKINKESVVLRKDGANFSLEFQPLIIGIDPKKEDK